MADVVHLFVDRIATPIGELTFVADGDARLRVVHWSDDGDGVPREVRRLSGTHEVVLERARNHGGLATALSAYFDGDLGIIDGLRGAAVGTPFQRSVWTALRDIPVGTTISYSELARRIGRPSAVRAVGAANGANPIAVVVPCHRVVGAAGALTGYGGGIARKRWLLAHEGAGRFGQLALPAGPAASHALEPAAVARPRAPEGPRSSAKELE